MWCVDKMLLIHKWVNAVESVYDDVYFVYLPLPYVTFICYGLSVMEKLANYKNE